MKAKLYIYIIMLMVLISCRYSQNKSLDAFNSQVKNYNERINRNDIFNIEDKLTMIKLFNSIHFYRLRDNTIYQSYSKNMYNLIEKDSIFNEFNFSYSIGMSLYSKEYDIFIGCITFHPNSTVFIDTMTLSMDSRQIVRDFIGTHKDEVRNSLLAK